MLILTLPAVQRDLHPSMLRFAILAAKALDAPVTKTKPVGEAFRQSGDWRQNEHRRR